MANCILEYCNIGKEYLRVEIPPYDKFPGKEILIELEDYLIENGVIKNPDAIAERIKSEFDINKFPPLTVYLRCAECFKTYLSLPLINKYQALILYKKDVKENGSDERYSTVYNHYKHKLGYIYNTYYMPLNIISSFKIIAKLLGTRLKKYVPFGYYLVDSLGSYGDYAAFYLRRGSATMIICVGGALVSAYDFPYENETDIMRQFLLVMSKHEFEFEHTPIARYALISDDNINLTLPIECVYSGRHREVGESIHLTYERVATAKPKEKKKKLRLGLFAKRAKKISGNAPEQKPAAAATAPMANTAVPSIQHKVARPTRRADGANPESAIRLAEDWLLRAEDSMRLADEAMHKVDDLITLRTRAKKSKK